MEASTWLSRHPGHLPKHLRRRVARAVVLPLVACALVLGFLVTARALALDTRAADRGAAEAASPTSPWRASYSRRFPGCVASVLWLERETPVAVVVRSSSGKVERMLPAEAARALDRGERDDAEIIGACYRR